jgi:hypothetical protein
MVNLLCSGPGPHIPADGILGTADRAVSGMLCSSSACLADQAAKDAATAWVPIETAVRTTLPLTVNAVETVVTQIPLPALSSRVGSATHFVATGILTGTTPSILARLRIGIAGTTADTQICATAAAVMTNGTAWRVEGYATVRSIGVGGTIVGQVGTIGEALATANRLSAQTAAVAVNTTVANILSLTLVGGGTAPVITVVQAFSEIVKQ